MDSDHAVLRVTFGLVGQEVVVAFRKVPFSSCKAVLVAKKEANCCW